MSDHQASANDPRAQWFVIACRDAVRYFFGSICCLEVFAKDWRWYTVADTDKKPYFDSHFHIKVIIPIQQASAPFVILDQGKKGLNSIKY